MLIFTICIPKQIVETTDLIAEHSSVQLQDEVHSKLLAQKNQELSHRFTDTEPTEGARANPFFLSQAREINQVHRYEEQSDKWHERLYQQNRGQEAPRLDKSFSRSQGCSNIHFFTLKDDINTSCKMDRVLISVRIYKTDFFGLKNICLYK